MNAVISWCVEEEVRSVVSSALLYLWTELLHNTDSSGLSCPLAHVGRQLLLLLHGRGGPTRRR